MTWQTTLTIFFLFNFFYHDVFSSYYYFIMPFLNRVINAQIKEAGTENNYD